MKHLNIFVLTILTFLSFESFSQSKVEVKVKLSPAGNFVARTSKVIGFATKTTDGYSAENIVVDATTLDTGISLRDKHLKERLQTEKYPKITLIKAVGKDGKGSGLIDIMGKQQKVSGTYKATTSNLTAQFSMHLPDLSIKKIRYMGIGVSDDVMIQVSLPIQNKK